MKKKIEREKHRFLFVTLSKCDHWVKDKDKIPFTFLNLEKETFADGEIIFNIPISVRDKDIILCQSLSRNVNDSVMELLIAIDALKRSSVKSISLVITYFGYARQDRKSKGREPITAKLISNLITFSKIKKIITIDLHSPQIEGFFDIAIDNLTFLPFLLERLLQQKINDYVLVSPDQGGYQRTQALASLLNVDFAVINKRRPQKNQTKIDFILGEVKNKNIILIDDMIDTANTLINSIIFLKEKKQVNDIYVVATHGIFSANALQRLNECYRKNYLKKIIISDSIKNDTQEKYPFLETYSLLPNIVNVLKIIENSSSISTYYKQQYQKLEKWKIIP